VEVSFLNEHQKCIPIMERIQNGLNIHGIKRYKLLCVKDIGTGKKITRNCDKAYFLNKLIRTLVTTKE
jgi:hypothetical protein